MTPEIDLVELAARDYDAYLKYCKDRQEEYRKEGHPRWDMMCLPILARRQEFKIVYLPEELPVIKYTWWERILYKFL